jgi:hypothetical protein
MSASPGSKGPPGDDSGVDSRLMLAGGVCVFLAGAVCGAMLYAFGIAGRQFNIATFRDGLLTFGVIALLLAVGIVLMTLLIQALALFWPRSMTIWSELRILKRAKKKSLGLLDQKKARQEERARLTARMQATYLLEKESAKVANHQSLKELRAALQLSAVRSCEIVYEHLNRTIDQYQELIAEIEASILETGEKRDLLNSLNSRLVTEAQEDRQRSAQSIMEQAIWEVRFRKARVMAGRRTDAAVAYLRKIRQRTDSHRILLQIDAMIREIGPSA